MEDTEKTIEKEVVIPEIQLEEGKIVLPTKDIPLVINGKEETITLQKLSSGVRRDLAKKHLNVKIVGQQVQGNMDPAGFQIGILSKVIIKAPFPINEEMIASFPDGALDYIYELYNEWTGDSKKKTRLIKEFSTGLHLDDMGLEEEYLDWFFLRNFGRDPGWWKKLTDDQINSLVTLEKEKEKEYWKLMKKLHGGK